MDVWTGDPVFRIVDGAEWDLELAETREWDTGFSSKIKSPGGQQTR
jgi:hypothetical protein